MINFVGTEVPLKSTNLTDLSEDRFVPLQVVDPSVIYSQLFGPAGVVQVAEAGVDVQFLMQLRGRVWIYRGSPWRAAVIKSAYAQLGFNGLII